MKRLPEGELSIMLKIWNENRPLYLEGEIASVYSTMKFPMECR